MSQSIRYARDGRVATITMDDGKVNSLNLEKLDALQRALDQAQADQAVVVLTGREQRFCAGFDLKVIMQGGSVASELVQRGFELVERILGFPTPVVIACNGHAMAMGVFLLLSADVRIGAEGPFKIGANEAAIGMTLPYAAIELCRMRLAPTHIVRAMACAEVFNPDQAVGAGYLDRVVPADQLHSSALLQATQLSQLNMAAYAATKQRVREPGMKALRAAVEKDATTFRVSS